VKLLYWVDVAFFLSFGVFMLSQPSRDIRYFIGMGMAVVGLALWVLARLLLGKSFSVSAQAKQLVTTGLYSKFRHPIYLFAGVGFTGLFVAWGKPYPLLTFLVIYSTQILRIRKEESVLEKAFGDEYRRYRARTWF
jgi:protein-S-isoprenylcysteine O-methyltransferase Ste14